MYDVPECCRGLVGLLAAIGQLDVGEDRLCVVHPQHPLQDEGGLVLVAKGIHKVPILEAQVSEFPGACVCVCVCVCVCSQLKTTFKRFASRRYT